MSDSATEQSETGNSPRLELTLRAVVLGVILAVVMGAANVYVGLRAGMTVSASIPAAVMAMVLFRLLFNNSTILEANQVQTCPSAGIQALDVGLSSTVVALLSLLSAALIVVAFHRYTRPLPPSQT
jgi:uncharacterized oligopeptide transporter (OPT) family protein